MVYLWYIYGISTVYLWYIYGIWSIVYGCPLVLTPSKQSCFLWVALIIANQLDTLQKMTNSLLVNVDIPIDTKRLARISFYLSI
jgi:hypothetical protein